jgi:hypothetical protein
LVVIVGMIKGRFMSLILTKSNKKNLTGFWNLSGLMKNMLNMLFVNLNLFQILFIDVLRCWNEFSMTRLYFVLKIPNHFVFRIFDFVTDSVFFSFVGF